MKIAIFGAGALGCYFGGRLLQAGYDVSFVARGAHLAALQEQGLTIESALGNAHIAPVRATDNPASIGAVDLVIFLVKLYDTATAANSLAPLLDENTAVVSFQNGVDGWDRIASAVGRERVFGGIAYIFADVRAPGVVRHSGSLAKLIFGELDGASSGRVATLESALNTADVDCETVNNVSVRIWEKFVVLSALSGVTTLTRLPIGDVLADTQCESLFSEALEESARVGVKSCPGLAADIAERQMSFARSLPHGMRASMCDDLEREKRLEVDHLSGAVVRLGESLGIATPVHSTILRALHPYAQGRIEAKG